MSMKKDAIEEHPISSLGIVLKHTLLNSLFDVLFLYAVHSFVVGIRISRRLFLTVGSFSLVQDNMAEAMLV